MLICNVEANYQFATLQSCFVICSRLNFFCVLVPASDIWLLYNRGCFASVFIITSCAGDIELVDLPRAGMHPAVVPAERCCDCLHIALHSHHLWGGKREKRGWRKGTEGKVTIRWSSLKRNSKIKPNKEAPSSRFVWKTKVLIVIGF